MAFAVLEPRADFDKCAIGMAARGDEYVLVYSKNKLIEMMLSGGSDYDDVVEYLEYNTYPPQTTTGWPIFLDDENFDIQFEIDNLEDYDDVPAPHEAV